MPRKTCATLFALAALAAAPTAPAAAATTTETSSNWAGYAVAKSGVTYRRVSATWTQRAVDCNSTRGRTFSAYWVGLGGLSSSSQALEQIGTGADCTTGGRAAYSAWYELVPEASVNIKSLGIGAGNRLSAAVEVRGRTVRLRLANLTTGRTFSTTLTASRVDVTSAEWIVEAPSLCDDRLQVCETQSLADFGTARFANAQATTTGGHTGTIADPAWAAHAISLGRQGRRPGFGPRRFAYDQASSAGATRGDRSASGSSFSVTYAAAT